MSQMWDEDGGMMKRKTFYKGKLNVFGLGFHISKYGSHFCLGFWYLGWQY